MHDADSGFVQVSATQTRVKSPRWMSEKSLGGCWRRNSRESQKRPLRTSRQQGRLDQGRRAERRCKIVLCLNAIVQLRLGNALLRVAKKPCCALSCFAGGHQRSKGEPAAVTTRYKAYKRWSILNQKKRKPSTRAFSPLPRSCGGTHRLNAPLSVVAGASRDRLVAS